MNFNTTLSGGDVSIYELDHHIDKLKGLQNGSDYEIEPGTFQVLWTFEVETRNWGVKGFSWYVTNITGSFDVVYFDENGDEKETETIEFDFEPFSENTDMSALDIADGCPGSLEIYYDNNAAILA
jgi:hypothetical protein